MNKAAIGIAAIAVLIGTPALAADMAVKAPPPPPAPVYSWTGWYVGGNVGYGPGTASNNLSFLQGTPPAAAAFGATDSVKVSGANGGVQAGYNWQLGDFLVGVGPDVQASGERGTNTFAGTIINLFPGGAGNSAAVITDSNKLDWFGTTRARLGFVSDRWLVYGTGGVGYGEINLRGNIQPANPFAGIMNAPIVWNQSATRVGWVAGTGVENAITRNWSWKLEYLYMDLGTATAIVSGGLGNGGLGNCYGTAGCNTYGPAASGTVTSHFTDNIVRFGLNYQFH